MATRGVTEKDFEKVAGVVDRAVNITKKDDRLEANLWKPAEGLLDEFQSWLG